LFSRVLRRLDEWLFGRPTVSGADAVLVACWLGLLIGATEAFIEWLRYRLTGDLRFAPMPDVYWLAPLGVATLAVLAMVAVLLVIRSLRDGLALRVPVAAGTAMLAYTALVGSRIGLQRQAAALLAAGIGLALARLADRHAGGFRRLAGVTAPVLLLLCVGTGSVRIALRSTGRGGPDGGAAAGSKNLIVIILDTVRATDLQLYGYSRSTTPEIERYIPRSVIFDQAFAPAPWTLPSHATLFTGRWPHELATNFDRPLAPTYPTLAEVLGQHGYRTGGFVANLTYTTRATGLARGFQTWLDFPLDFGAFLSSSRWTRLVARVVGRALGYRGWLMNKDAGAVTDQFLDWLNVQPDRPFFAFLNYFDAHEPYATRPPFETLFSAGPPRYWTFSSDTRDFSEAQLQEWIDAYDSCIAYIDHEIGLVLDDLERRGLLENTVVVIASDHGDQFGEHGLLSHRNSLYMPLVRVPLILLGATGAPGGIRVTEPVSLRDVPATALGLLDLDAGALGGHSLVPLIRPEPVAAEVSPIRMELDAYDAALESDPVHRGPMRGAVDGTWHYIRNGDGSEELYDFVSDPAESHNRAGDPALAEVIGKLREIAGPAADPPAG
jgi:arylsulfatase A-like enzyme